MQHKQQFKTDMILFSATVLLGDGDEQNALHTQNTNQASLTQRTSMSLQQTEGKH